MTAPNPAVQIQGMAVVTADNFNTYVQTVKNYAQLRTFTGLGNMVVMAQGASAPDDGGQALYYYNSTSVAPDNNSTVIVPTGAVQGGWLQLPANLNVSNLTGILPILNGGTGNSTGAVAATSLTGIVPAANGGADSISGVLSGNGAGLVSQGATTGLSDTIAPVAWTPVDTSGASLGFTSVSGLYTKIGKIVIAQFRLTFPTTVNGASVNIGALPYTVSSLGTSWVAGIATSGAGSPNAVMSIVTSAGSTSFTVINTNGATPINSALSTDVLEGTLTYISN
jgi:hypothetical protein